MRALPADRSRWILALCALVGAIVYWSPALRVLDATGFGDWQMVHHNWEVGYVALRRFGEWPLWNPFFCGGITAFGNPESQWFSPLTWLSLLTGTTVGTKVFLILHCAIGLGGMYTLVHRELRLGRAASVFAAAAWGMSGFFAWHGAGGHATFLPFYFAPWLLLCVRRAPGDLRYAIGAALLLSLTLYEGGTYPFPYFVLWLALDTLLLAPMVVRDRVRTVALLRSLALMMLLTVLLGAVRLLPIADALSQLPRETTDDDALRLGELVEMLTAREHGWRNPPHRFVWPEYGTFVGWTVLVMSALGVVAVLRRRQWTWLVGLGVMVAITMGEGGPWSWLHHLPVFDSLRVPSRFMVLVTFYLAVIAAHGVEQVSAWLRADRQHASIWRRGAIWLPVVLATADILVVNLRTVNRWDGPPVVAGPAAERFELLPVRNFHHLYASLPARHQGITGCYGGGMNWVVSPALWTGARPQARFEPASDGELLSFTRTVNTVTLAVRVARDGDRLVLNQNYDRDWHANVGDLADDRGRLAITLPAGEHRIDLRYRPRTLWPGLGLTLLGMVLTFVAYRWSRHADIGRAT